MGLSGSGKTTLGKGLYEHLKLKGVNNLVYLDGDEFRDILGHFDYDRDSRIEVAKKRAMFCQMLSKQGIIVIASSISMFKENYIFNRQNIGEYFEVYVQCDIDELKKRNQKGLYDGSVENVVGVNIRIDKPNPDLILKNGIGSLDKNLILLKNVVLDILFDR